MAKFASLGGFKGLGKVFPEFPMPTPLQRISQRSGGSGFRVQENRGLGVEGVPAPTEFGRPLTRAG